MGLWGWKIIPIPTPYPYPWGSRTHGSPAYSCYYTCIARRTSVNFWIHDLRILQKNELFTSVFTFAKKRQGCKSNKPEMTWLILHIKPKLQLTETKLNPVINLGLFTAKCFSFAVAVCFVNDEKGCVTNARFGKKNSNSSFVPYRHSVTPFLRLLGDPPSQPKHIIVATSLAVHFFSHYVVTVGLYCGCSLLE